MRDEKLLVRALSLVIFPKGDMGGFPKGRPSLAESFIYLRLAEKKVKYNIK